MFRASASSNHNQSANRDNWNDCHLSHTLTPHWLTKFMDLISKRVVCVHSCMCSYAYVQRGGVSVHLLSPWIIISTMHKVILWGYIYSSALASPALSLRLRVSNSLGHVVHNTRKSNTPGLAVSTVSATPLPTVISHQITKWRQAERHMTWPEGKLVRNVTARQWWMKHSHLGHSNPKNTGYDQQPCIQQ